MKITEKIKQEWKAVKEKGDNDLLAAILKITPQNVSRITNGGDATPTQIKKIAKFFEKKQREVAKYVQEDDNN